MAPRRDVSEERKNQILDAAMNVFTREGIHTARMDDIVDESGLSKGALYWYYKSKDEIIFAILSKIFEGELAELRTVLESEGTAGERLLAYLDRSIEEISRITRLRPLMYEFYALSMRQGPFRKTLQHFFRSYMSILIPLIEQGIAQGEFRAVNAQEAAVASAAIYEGAVILWVYDPDTIDLKKHIRTSMQLLLDGLRP